MLVSVTGGTGFVGAHSVAAMVRRGHRVRVLTRDETRVARALSPLGVDPDEVGVVTGDVTDEGSVSRAVRGADAVLHAAGVYSFDSRRHAEMRSVNEWGTDVVLAAARRLAAGPVVHVSTFGVLEPDDRRRVRAEAPVGRPRETYTATKAGAERIARRHQAEGAPVVIAYPPALLGPHDPNLGDQNRRLRNVLRGLMPMWPSGGFPVGDVRDTASALADLLTGSGRGRHVIPGTRLSTRRYVETLREVTGRKLPAVFLPARAMLPVGRLANLVQHAWPWHIPAEYGAVHICFRDVRAAPDTSAAPSRTVVETFEDSVRWLHREGHVTDRQAGSVSRPPGTAHPARPASGETQEVREEGR